MPEFTDSPALGPPQGRRFQNGILDLPGCKLPRDRFAPHQGDQRFESPTLQRRVGNEISFLHRCGAPYR